MPDDRTAQRPFCDQLTVRGDLCMHRAMWERDERDGLITERYCTRHANIYGVPRGEGGRSRRLGDDGLPIEAER